MRSALSSKDLLLGANGIIHFRREGRRRKGVWGTAKAILNREPARVGEAAAVPRDLDRIIAAGTGPERIRGAKGVYREEKSPMMDAARGILAPPRTPES